MIKDYSVNIPPLFSEVLAEIGGVSPAADFDEIIEAARTPFFAFYSPEKLTAAQARKVETFIMNRYIMRRVGSGNVKKFKQIFKNRWLEIMPYYERLIETQENETNYFADPILTVDVGGTTSGTGTRDTQENTTHGAETDFTTQRTGTHTGSGTHNTDDETGRTASGTTGLTHSGEDSKTHSGEDSKTHSGQNSGTTSGQSSKTHSGQSSESGSSSEINRYSDTPQGNAANIWETYVDEQGHTQVRLTDLYLTDIRGITGSSQRSGNDSATDTETSSGTSSGTDSYTESGENSYTESGENSYTDAATSSNTESGTLERRETMSDTANDTQSGTDKTELEESGSRVLDEDTTHTETTTRKGFEGTSPVDLLEKYRDSFKRIYEALAADLEQCFYNVVEVDDLIDYV